MFVIVQLQSSGTTLFSARHQIWGFKTKNKIPQLKIFLKVLAFQYEIEFYKQVTVSKKWHFLVRVLNSNCQLANQYSFPNDVHALEKASLFKHKSDKGGGGERGAVILTLRKEGGPGRQKKFFRPFGPQFGVKVREGGIAGGIAGPSPGSATVVCEGPLNQCNQFTTKMLLINMLYCLWSY